MTKVIDFNKVQGDPILIESTSFHSKGYGTISQHVTRNKNISVQAKGVYGYLVSCAGNDKQTYPTQALMCEELGIKKPLTLRKYIKELQAEGLVKIVKTTKKSLFYKNIYLICDNTVTQEIWKNEYLQGKEEEEMEVIEDNKKVPPAQTDTTKKPSKSKKAVTAGTDTTQSNSNNINNNVNNSIPQKQDNDTRNLDKNEFGNNYQSNKDNQEEINYEKIAYENLKSNPIFQKLPEVAKQARIKNEINKIKVLGLYS